MVVDVRAWSKYISYRFLQRAILKSFHRRLPEIIGNVFVSCTSTTARAIKIDYKNTKITSPHFHTRKYYYDWTFSFTKYKGRTPKIETLARNELFFNNAMWQTKEVKRWYVYTVMIYSILKKKPYMPMLSLLINFVNKPSFPPFPSKIFLNRYK